MTAGEDGEIPARRGNGWARSPKLRYLAQSAFIFGLNLGTTATLHEVVGLRQELAFGLSQGLVIVAGFLSLKYFVFSVAGGRGIHEFLVYLPSVLVFRTVEWFLFLLIATRGGVQYLLAIFLIQGTIFIGKYFYFRAKVFRIRD